MHDVYDAWTFKLPLADHGEVEVTHNHYWSASPAIALALAQSRYPPQTVHRFEMQQHAGAILSKLQHIDSPDKKIQK